MSELYRRSPVSLGGYEIRETERGRGRSALSAANSHQISPPQIYGRRVALKKVADYTRDPGRLPGPHVSASRSLHYITPILLRCLQQLDFLKCTLK